MMRAAITALTSEKLNLYDQALKEYQLIQGAHTQNRLGTDPNDRGKRRARNIQDIAPDVYRIIGNAPDEQKYPQAGALVLLCRGKDRGKRRKYPGFRYAYIIKILKSA